MRSRFLQPCALVVLAIGSIALTAVGEEPAEPLFERDVLPILQDHCVKCHGGESRKAELDLSSISGARKGGESGLVLQPGDADESLLLEMIHDGVMPPEDETTLTDRQKNLIGRWIETGAKSTLAEESVGRELSLADVLPIMLRRCVMCHGAEYKFGGVDLRTHGSIMAGGDNGPALVVGKPDDSLIVQRVRSRECPPKADIGEAGIEPMPPVELAVVVGWIDTGAADNPLIENVATAGSDLLVSDEDREFWSFQSPVKSVPPNTQTVLEAAGAAVETRPDIRNAIDAFLLDKLQQRGLAFSLQADKITLARRAAYALTGLPPDQRLIDDFISDESEFALERMLDTLLGTPRYGEKWGRFWLDLAGYTDSEGKRNADMIRPFAWKYRDWVIRAFNSDKPYDEFLLEQIAGDELVDWARQDAVTQVVIDKLIATGFLRMAPDGTSADTVNSVSDRLEVISDELDILGRGIMGLTLNCARCHSHKYDPIPQRDYYRLVAVFKGAYDEYDWLTPQPFGNQWNKAKRRHMTVLTPQQRCELEAHNAPIEEQLAKLRADLQDKSTDKDRKKELQREIKSLEQTLRPVPQIRALWDRGRPSPTFVYRRGDETQPAGRVEPGLPSALTDGSTPFEPKSPGHASPKTGRRLAFAQWLTQPNHPLTARVIVNRVWHQHFGHGLVESLDNFGRLGTAPSHPELLDWLAVEFVESGWSIKSLHRLILSSTAWRQSSLITPKHEQLDPDNRLLSRMPMRRLSAEEVRDTILQVAARLDETPFGEPDPVEVRQDGLVTSKPENGKWRRSVYLRQRRKEMPTIFETFDLPQMAPNCTERQTSTVVTQSLLLLNNRMIYDLAGDFAQRVRRTAGADCDRQVHTAFRMALNRSPSPEELQAGMDTIRELEQQWSDSENGQVRPLADFCHALLNSASLLYID